MCSCHAGQAPTLYDSGHDAIVIGNMEGNSNYHEKPYSGKQRKRKTSCVHQREKCLASKACITCNKLVCRPLKHQLSDENIPMDYVDAVGSSNSSASDQETERSLKKQNAIGLDPRRV